MIKIIVEISGVHFGGPSSMANLFRIYAHILRGLHGCSSRLAPSRVPRRRMPNNEQFFIVRRTSQRRPTSGFESSMIFASLNLKR